MEKHTKKILKQNWGDDDTVSHRAVRGEGTSAPDESEIKVFEKYLKEAINNKSKPKALILGATPELRDIAIEYGLETVTVDISENLAIALTKAMKHRDSPLNKILIGDWLNMDNIFEKDSFDVIMGDASLNNVPIEKYDEIMGICKYLLKKGGFFIHRQLVYDPSVKNQSYDSLIERLNKNELSCVGFIVQLGLYTKLKKDFLDKENKMISWKHATETTIDSFKDKVSKSKWAPLYNLCYTAKGLKSVILTRDELEGYFKKFFVIKRVSSKYETPLSRDFPIHMLEKK
ncbi:MAG: class I SAM-dependent methyltransferase [archaeon]